MPNYHSKFFQAWDVIIRHRAQYSFVKVGQSLFPVLDLNLERHSLGNGKKTIPGYYACFKKNMWRPMLQFKVNYAQISDIRYFLSLYSVTSSIRF